MRLFNQRERESSSSNCLSGNIFLLTVTHFIGLNSINVLLCDHRKKRTRTDININNDYLTHSSFYYVNIRLMTRFVSRAGVFLRYVGEHKKKKHEQQSALRYVPSTVINR